MNVTVVPKSVIMSTAADNRQIVSFPFKHRDQWLFELTYCTKIVNDHSKQTTTNNVLFLGVLNGSLHHILTKQTTVFHLSTTAGSYSGGIVK